MISFWAVFKSIDVQLHAQVVAIQIQNRGQK